ncbi:MAG: transcription antitermination factor NusB [Deltaproteobacteria bacterium]|nr:transcription antitermination factor NusB [Deltaproteobacteria bacterium]
MGHRRQSRECALQLLYQIDVGGSPISDTISDYWEAHAVPSEVSTFADELVRGTCAQHAIIDEAIAKHSANWRLPRMAAVDRNILRMAVYELYHCPDIPVRVTLNEAIEIGKKFGTEESGAFINGILDQVAKELNKPME